MSLLALILAAAAVQPAVASPTPGYPTTRGTAGVTFFLPSGSDPRRLIGGTYFIANDLAVRADFGLSAPFSPSGAGQNTLFTLSAGLRFYQLKREHVALFWQPVVAIGRENSPAVTAEAAEFLRLGGGVGVEYFFANHFSVGATLEVTLKIANLSGPAATPVYTSLSTETSTLSANIYF